MIFPDNIEKENEPGDTKQTKENLKHFTTDVIKCFSKQSLFGDEPANLWTERPRFMVWLRLTWYWFSARHFYFQSTTLTSQNMGSKMLKGFLILYLNQTTHPGLIFHLHSMENYNA